MGPTESCAQEGRSGSASLPVPGAVVLPGDEGPVPPEQSIGRDERGDLPESLGSEDLRAISKSAALGVRKSELPRSHLLSQDAVLLLEVFDDVLLPALEPSRQADGEKHQGFRDHQAIVAQVRGPIEFWDTSGSASTRSVTPLFREWSRPGSPTKSL